MCSNTGSFSQSRVKKIDLISLGNPELDLKRSMLPTPTLQLSDALLTRRMQTHISTTVTHLSRWCLKAYTIVFAPTTYFTTALSILASGPYLSSLESTSSACVLAASITVPLVCPPNKSSMKCRQDKRGLTKAETNSTVSINLSAWQTNELSFKY